MSIAEILYLICSFYIGGIPFGLIICKVFGNVDIRTLGSKNIGATNAGRILGKKYAIATFILDGLKSFIPVLMAKNMFDFNIATLTLFACVMGHIFTPWLKFKGGKGFSSMMLASLALDYRLFIVMLLTWVLCFRFTKISALSTLISLVLMSVFAAFLLETNYFYIILMTVIIMFWAHRENIKRLINQEEKGF